MAPQGKSVVASEPQQNAVVASREFDVQIPNPTSKRYNVMRFMQSAHQKTLEWDEARMERENNLKLHRTEVDDLPKSGTFSEYGKDFKNEARRRKYDSRRKKYYPDSQPWQRQVGGKQGKRYKGTREGGVVENAIYYIFFQSPTGEFEAYPVEQWYKFTAVQNYETLTAEEAEEAYNKRDKIINHFAVMVNKRLADAQGQTTEEDPDEDDGSEEIPKEKKGQGSLKLSDMDEWVGHSDGSDADSVSEETEGSLAKKKTKLRNEKKKDKKAQESDSSAKEDSDDGDFEREVDHMTSDSDSSDDEPEDLKANKQMKGVENENVLRQLVLSGEDDDELRE